MRLLSLALRNFKGHKNLEFTFDDITILSGANGTGKTSVFDAFCWLLTGKDSLGRVCGTGQKGEATIRPRQADGELLRVVEVSVTGWFKIDGPDVYTLQRIFCETYSTNKNSGEKFFKGNTTKYFINGVPTPAAKYEAWVKEHINPETLKLTSDPAYFPGLPWQDQRALLLKIAGDVDDATVIASDRALEPLGKLQQLYNHSIEDIKVTAAAQLKLANKAVKEGMVRIDQTVTLAGNATEADLAAQIAKQEELVKAQDEAVTQAESACLVGDYELSLKRDLEHISREADLVRQKFEAAAEAARRAAYQMGQELSWKMTRAKAEIDSLGAKHQGLVQTVADLLSDKEALYQDYDKTYAEKIDTFGPCPYCGQELPEDKKSEMVARHNRDKAARLEAIVKKGKALNQKIMETQKAAEWAHAQFLQKQKEYDDLREQDLAPKPAAGSVEDLPEYQALMEKKRKAEQALAGAAVPDKSAELANLEEARRIRTQLQYKLGELQGRMKILQTITTLRQDLQTQRENADAAAEKLRLVTAFIAARCRMVSDKVNTLFPGLQWRLFQQNVTNDDIVETCELTAHGVGYRDLSQGEKIRAGLVIVNTLQEKLQAVNPVWIDGAESITFTPVVKSQLVLLKAQENKNTLDVEVQKWTRA